MALPLIKLHSSGALVENWQDFLIGQNFLTEPADGEFGPDTQAATITFQNQYGLAPDGVVGNHTYAVAMQHGFNGVDDDRTGKDGAAWPPKPAFPPLVSNDQRAVVFGKFAYVPDPQPGEPEQIRITDGWQKNIIAVPIPQLQQINGEGHIQFHHLAAAQLAKLWADWENAGLLYLILHWDGSFNPRFVRGSKVTLSNHAFGSAFDINAAWNGYGAQPALVGQKGCVRELVGIANQNGFYWGGHFTKQDGMHFEIAYLIP